MNAIKLCFIIFIAQLISGCNVFERNGVNNFLGLEFGKELTHVITEKDKGPPSLAPGLKPYYEIDYPNMEFDTVGVALTENLQSDTDQGYKFKNKVIWGAAFLNKKNKNPCTQIDYDKILNSIKRDYQLKFVIEHAGKGETKLKYDFDKWTVFYSKGALWTVICSDTTKAIVIMDLSVVIRESDNEKTKNLFKKQQADFESTLSRTL